MTIKWFDFAAERQEIGPSLSSAIDRVLRDSRFIRGPEVQSFEAEFASYCGAKYCVGVGNGLDALHLGLRALGVGPGDEVIVPAHTFIATWLAVTYSGATPVPVDIHPDSYNIDPEAFRAAIGPRTKAVIPVDLYGSPSGLDQVIEVAHRSNIVVLEDAAQSHGASLPGRRVGSLADVTAFSFYPVKNLGALGDGGAITTESMTVASRVRQMGNYGSEEKYRHSMLGFNSRLDELQAAVLRVKLPHLDEWNSRRRSVAGRYLRDLDDGELALPKRDVSGNAWHLFPILFRDRDSLQHHLSAAGIPSMVHYPIPPHLQPAYASLGYRSGAFPVAERVAREELSLPISPFLTPSEVDLIIREVRAGVSANR